MTDLSFPDDTILRRYGPGRFLSHMLSTQHWFPKSSSSSTTANNYQTTANETSDLENFRQIGKGQCGTVWAVNGAAEVLKVANEGKKGQLYNDFCSHAQVEEALQQTHSQLRKHINIPRLAGWVTPQSQMFLKDSRKLLPEENQPNYGILSNRISPVFPSVCSALVDAFAPKEVIQNKSSFLSQPENQDCLIRVYLGRRQQRPAKNTFKLRNFDMMVNEMEYLQLDTDLYAVTMAQTLAIIHWRARLDANDIEFVLGRIPKMRMRATLAEYKASSPDEAGKLCGEIDFKQRSIGIWVLDFDQCNTFSEDLTGIEQLERGFYFNDPYFPRPISKHPNDVRLWNRFKDTYLATSAAITNSDLPEQFILAIEAEGRRRSLGCSLFQ